MQQFATYFSLSGASAGLPGEGRNKQADPQPHPGQSLREHVVRNYNIFNSLANIVGPPNLASLRSAVKLWPYRAKEMLLWSVWFLAMENLTLPLVRQVSPSAGTSCSRLHPGLV